MGWEGEGSLSSLTFVSLGNWWLFLPSWERSAEQGGRGLRKQAVAQGAWAPPHEAGICILGMQSHLRLQNCHCRNKFKYESYGNLK